MGSLFAALACGRNNDRGATLPKNSNFGLHPLAGSWTCDMAGTDAPATKMTISYDGSIVYNFNTDGKAYTGSISSLSISPTNTVTGIWNDAWGKGKVNWDLMNVGGQQFLKGKFTLKMEDRLEDSNEYWHCTLGPNAYPSEAFSMFIKSIHGQWTYHSKNCSEFQPTPIDKMKYQSGFTFDIDFENQKPVVKTIQTLYEDPACTVEIGKIKLSNDTQFLRNFDFTQPNSYTFKVTELVINEKIEGSTFGAKFIFGSARIVKGAIKFVSGGLIFGKDERFETNYRLDLEKNVLYINKWGTRADKWQELKRDGDEG